MTTRRDFKRYREHGHVSAGIAAKRVRLDCGHEATAHPVAVVSGQFSLYACPQGCPGLTKVRAK